MNSIRKRNIRLFYMHGGINSCITILAFGNILQTFMLECGIDEGRVSLYVAAVQVVQAVMMLLLSRYAEGVQHIRPTLAVTMVPFLPFFGSLLFLSLYTGVAPTIQYILLFAISLVLHTFWALNNILVYKLPHEIMDIGDYGRVTGFSGVLAGIIGMGLSAAMTFIVGRWGYFPAMAMCSAVGLAFTVVCGWLFLAFRPVNDLQTSAVRTRINLFRYKPFYSLLFPNFSRGFSLGIFNLVTVLGYSAGILDSASAVVISTLTQVATLASCQIYSMIAGRWKNGVVILVSSVIFCVAAPLMMAGHNTTVFFVFYFIAFFFVNIVAYGVPVLVATRIDYRCLGQYTAWRMALFTLGIAVGSACVPLLIRLVGVAGTLMACGLTLLPCGIGYYRFEKQSLQATR